MGSDFLRKAIAAAIFVALATAPALRAHADETSEVAAATPESVVQLGFIPPTMQDFRFLQAGATTPERGATLFIMAMLTQELDASLAEQMVIEALTDDNLVTKSDGTKVLLPYMKDHLKRLAKDPNIAHSYVEGATPQNGYVIPEGQGYTFHFSRNRLSEVSETEVRVYVATSGAGTPRPVFLKKQPSGIWKAQEVGSLFVGIYRPATEGN